MFVDERYYLEHYGTKGMRWGVRRAQAHKQSRPEKAVNRQIKKAGEKWRSTSTREKVAGGLKVAAIGATVAAGAIMARNIIRQRKVTKLREIQGMKNLASLQNTIKSSLDAIGETKIATVREGFSVGSGGARTTKPLYKSIGKVPAGGSIKGLSDWAAKNPAPNAAKIIRDLKDTSHIWEI